MELPQIIALSVGLVAAAIVALYAYGSHTAKKRATARTFELFSKGVASAEIVPHLVAEGLDQETAVALVERAARTIVLSHPTSMLEAGHSQAEVLADLVSRGVDPTIAERNVAEAALFLWYRRWWFLLLPAGLALVLVGAAVALLGLVLRDGNRTGKWVTFPFAGGVTMTAGACVAGVGATIIALVFGEAG